MAIFRYNAEAYENEYERHVGGRESHECPIHVDDECLEGRKYRTTEDGHDKTGTANLHIITHTAQGNTIDGGEHQRHGGAYSHKAIKTVAVGEKYNSSRGTSGNHRQYHKQTTWLYVF